MEAGLHSCSSSPRCFVLTLNSPEVLCYWCCPAREKRLASPRIQKGLEMSLRRNLSWILLAFAIVFLLAGISMPNLLRSRLAANQSASYGRFYRSKLNVASAETQADQGTAFALKASVPPQSSPVENKLIRNAELHMTVVNMRDTFTKIAAFAESSGGKIDHSEIADSIGYSDATILIRVPSEGLNSALSEIKKLSLHVDKEEETARDVTREFYDNEAHLRNLRSEEEQYLSILKNAHTIKDTVEVAEHLSDVRDRIERLQAQIQVMSHDIAMSTIAVSLMQQSQVTVLGIQWRPLNSLKVATHELLSGLGEWLDWIIACLIKLPLFIVWAGTIMSIGLIVWKIGKWAWIKLRPTE